MNCLNYDHIFWVTLCTKCWHPASRLALEDCSIQLVVLPTQEDYSSHSKKRASPHCLSEIWQLRVCSYKTDGSLLRTKWLWCLHARNLILFNNTRYSYFGMQTFFKLREKCPSLVIRHRGNISSLSITMVGYICDSIMCRARLISVDPVLASMGNDASCKNQFISSCLYLSVWSLHYVCASLTFIIAL